MILVTGGTGLIGSHLLLQLTQKHETIRAIYRDASKLEHVKTVFSYYTKNAASLFKHIEWVEADITNIPALETAFETVEYVYHCAGFISFAPNDFNQLKKINIEGTANVVNLSITNGVKKLCHVSSIAALGVTLNKPITEETHWNPEAHNSCYAISKYGAEMEVWRGSREGLDIVIVNPGIVLGPGFWDSGSGIIFSTIYKGLKFYTTGTSGYVAVNDIVKAMLQLTESAIKNERFILVAENLSFKLITEKISECFKKKAPTKEAKPYLLEIGWRLDWLKHFLFKSPRTLSKTLAKTAHNKEEYDNSKIKEQLNFNFESIEDAIAFSCKIYLNKN